MIARGFLHIHDHQVIAPEIPDETGRRPDDDLRAHLLERLPVLAPADVKADHQPDPSDVGVHRDDAAARQVIERLSRPVPPAAEADSFAAPAGARPPWYRDRGVLYAATAMILAVEALVVALGNVFMRS